jgi:hypothetical protein
VVVAAGAFVLELVGAVAEGSTDPAHRPKSRTGTRVVIGVGE